MNGSLVTLIASIVLSSTVGCGSGVVPRSPGTQLVVIGNSITHHLPESSIGWSGDWGMAATAENKDFAHLTATALHVPLTTFNIAPLEWEPTLATSLIPTVITKIDSNTDVIVELGHDVTKTSTGVAAFRFVYHQLLNSVQSSKSITCTSTFWSNSAVDNVIKSECFAVGGRYVYIGNIGNDAASLAANPFSNPDVEGHPRDKAMAEISRRLFVVITNQPY